MPLSCWSLPDGERRPPPPEPISGEVPQTKVFPALHSLSVSLTLFVGEVVLNRVAVSLTHSKSQALNVESNWATAMMATLLLC